MPRLSLIVGAIAAVLFITAFSAMRLLIHGEEDWYFGIGLVISLLAAIGISVIGVILSSISLYRFPAQRIVALFGLVLNLVPSVTWFVLWVELQMRLR